MTASDPPAAGTPPKWRWYRLTPDRAIISLLAAIGFLLLSEQFRWFAFNEHKGWTVLIALAAVALTLALMSLWLAGALLFRWRFQYGLRSLFLLVTVVAVGCSWLATEIELARGQAEAAAICEKAGGGIEYDNKDHPGNAQFVNPVPSEPRWLLQLLGNDFFHDHEVVAATVVNDLGMEQLKRLPKLRTLRVAMPDVADSGMRHLDALEQLETLEFLYTRLTDAGLVHLRKLNQLKMLDLSGTKVTDIGLTNLRGMSHLQTLVLCGAKITDAGLNHLEPLHELRYLILSMTRVTDAGLAHIEGMDRLRELWLDETNVSDAGLEHVRGLRRLQFLSLLRTKVTDRGVLYLRQELPKCRIQYSATGPKPEEDGGK